MAGRAARCGSPGKAPLIPQVAVQRASGPPRFLAELRDLQRPDQRQVHSPKRHGGRHLRIVQARRLAGPSPSPSRHHSASVWNSLRRCKHGGFSETNGQRRAVRPRCAVACADNRDKLRDGARDLRPSRSWRGKRQVIGMRRKIAGRGGAEGTRTPGLLIANEALSQLSYSPVPQGADNAQRPRRSQATQRSCRLRTE